MMFDTHDATSDDHYVKPIFPLQDKIQRLIWNITWSLLCRWTPKPMHNWRVWVLRKFGAKLGRQNFIYPSCKIWAPWLLETEDVVTIGPGVEVYNPGGVLLRHHAILSQDAFLCGATHDYNSIEFTYIKKKIVLDAYVWICAKAIVLPGVHCCEGSVLGAGSITTRDLDPWTVYAGNPARPVRKRQYFLTEPIARV